MMKNTNEKWLFDKRDLYYKLLRIRRVEQAICDIYPSDRIKSPVHLSLGQEAIPVAVCQYLTPSDIVFGTYRSHALYLAKGGDLNLMMAELYGKSTGCGKGRAGSMHLIDLNVGMMGTSAVVGTTLPNAVGYAYAQKLKSAEAITVCFIGDGATEEGSFYESVNFAALKQLPILIVCENNGYAIHSEIESRQANTNIQAKAESLGVPGRRHDMTDFCSLIEVVGDLVRDIKTRRGPRFLEVDTYRDIQHVGIGHDYDLGYRVEEDAELWRTRDPIDALRIQLPENEVKTIQETIDDEIAQAVRFAEESEFPAVDELLINVFG